MQKKRLDLKDKVNFKIHDVTTLSTNNYNTHIAQYLKKYIKCAGEIIHRPLSKK